MNAPTITGLDCGWMRTQRRTLSSDGGTDEIAIPIIAWLIRHPDGVAVFDVGLHPDLASSTESLGALAKIFSVDLAPDGTIGPRLEQQGVDPSDPILAVLSHGHFDHVGGLAELPNARVVVQRDEWRAARDGDGYDLALIDLGHEVTELAGTHDVFGDGTVTCIPTPGHTCGHQSIRVLTADGPVILAADACYFAHTLDDEVLPPFAHDFENQRASLQMLRRERSGGAVIVPGHDAAVFRAWTSNDA